MWSTCIKNEAYLKTSMNHVNQVSLIMKQTNYLDSSSSKNLILAIRLERVSVPSDLSPLREGLDIFSLFCESNFNTW